MSDPLDPTQEIPETPWLGTALAVAGTLIVASAAVLLFLVVDGLCGALGSPVAWVICGLLGVALVRLGRFGIVTFGRGVSMIALWTW